MNSIVLKDIHNLIENKQYDRTFRESTILITGATGHIAKYISFYFLELNRSKDANNRIILLARNQAKAEKVFADYLDDPGVEFLYQDVCDPLNCNIPADYIFHAAGSASAVAIRSNPVGIIKANTIGTINVLDYAVKNGCKKVLFLSTREIYGKVDGVDNITEGDMGVMDPLSSRNCYPESKRMAEALLESYHNQYGIDYNVLRIAHTYGPEMSISNDGRVMADFMDCVVHDRDIVLNSDGSAIRGFCYVADTLNGILMVAAEGEPDAAYNLANETEPKMIRDVAQMLVAASGNENLSVQYKEADEATKKGYLGYKIVRLDTSRIEELGWKPEVLLQDGLKRTLDYFKEEGE